MSAESAGEVSGPVAMTTGRLRRDSGIRSTSSRTTVMSGCASTAASSPPRSARGRRPARRPPGTRTASATRMTSEPSRRISSFSRPTALSSLSLRSELLQTSSARSGVSMDVGAAHRPHLVNRHRYAARRHLPGRLAPGETAADDVDHGEGSTALGSGLRAQDRLKAVRRSCARGSFVPRGAGFRARAARLCARPGLLPRPGSRSGVRAI